LALTSVKIVGERENGADDF